MFCIYCGMVMTNNSFICFLTLGMAHLRTPQSHMQYAAPHVSPAKPVGVTNASSPFPNMFPPAGTPSMRPNIAKPEPSYSNATSMFGSPPVRTHHNAFVASPSVMEHHGQNMQSMSHQPSPMFSTQSTGMASLFAVHPAAALQSTVKLEDVVMHDTATSTMKSINVRWQPAQQRAAVTVALPAKSHNVRAVPNATPTTANQFEFPPVPTGPLYQRQPTPVPLMTVIDRNAVRSLPLFADTINGGVAQSNSVAVVNVDYHQGHMDDSVTHMVNHARAAVTEPVAPLHCQRNRNDAAGIITNIAQQWENAVPLTLHQGVLAAHTTGRMLTTPSKDHVHQWNHAAATASVQGVFNSTPATRMHPNDGERDTNYQHITDMSHQWNDSADATVPDVRDSKPAARMITADDAAESSNQHNTDISYQWNQSSDATVVLDVRDSKPAARLHTKDGAAVNAAEVAVPGVFDSKPATRNGKRLPNGKRHIGKLSDKPTPMRKEPGSPRKRNRLPSPNTLAFLMPDTAVHYQPDNRRRTRQSPSPSPVGGDQHPNTRSRLSPGLNSMGSNASHVTHNAAYEFETVYQNEVNDASGAVANADDEYDDDL